MPDGVIGISTSGMRDRRKNVSSALGIIYSTKKNLNSALNNLNSDNNSSRLNESIEAISKEYTQMQKIETNMEQIGKYIDYAIVQFQNVDNSCAEVIGQSSYTYRKSISLLTSEEKYGNILGSAIDSGTDAWKKYSKEAVDATAYITNLPPFKAAIKFWNNNHVGAYLYTGVELAVGIATVYAAVPLLIATIAAAPETGGASLVVAIPVLLALAHGANSSISGLEDLNSISKGDFDKVGENTNWLRDKGYGAFGGFAGYHGGQVVDKITGDNNAKYSNQFCSYGKAIGVLRYTGADIYFGNGVVKDSLAVVKDGDTVNTLAGTTLKMNGYDSSKVVQWTEKGASATQKGYAALNGSSNAAGVAYDSNDGIGEVKKDTIGAWHVARSVLFGVQ